ncbi:MAG TPA: MltA domain-containing protein, partial [bacterium]|nr:MltA domain-containing protein [bacterium]
MKTMKGVKKVFLLCVVLLMGATTFGCHASLRKESKPPEEALRKTGLSSIRFDDDMDRDSLTLAVRRNLDYLDRLPPGTVFRYGPHDFTCQQVRESQSTFLNLLSKGLDADQLSREIRKTFQLYRAAGRVEDGRVLFTGYYEPAYEGSLFPDETFRYPLYRAPDDLVRIDLSP